MDRPGAEPVLAVSHAIDATGASAPPARVTAGDGCTEGRASGLRTPRMQEHLRGLRRGRAAVLAQRSGLGQGGWPAADGRDPRRRRRDRDEAGAEHDERCARAPPAPTASGRRRERQGAGRVRQQLDREAEVGGVAGGGLVAVLRHEAGDRDGVDRRAPRATAASCGAGEAGHRLLRQQQVVGRAGDRVVQLGAAGARREHGGVGRVDVLHEHDRHAPRRAPRRSPRRCSAATRRAAGRRSAGCRRRTPAGRRSRAGRGSVRRSWRDATARPPRPLARRKRPSGQGRHRLLIGC